MPILVPMPAASGAAADHHIGIGLGQGGARELPGAAADGAEQRPLRIVPDARLLDVGGEIGLKVMVAGHGVCLAALFP